MKNRNLLSNSLFINLFIAILYFLAGGLGEWFVSPPSYASAIWPASGVALGAMLIWGSRAWLGIFVGALFINNYVTMLSGQPFWSGITWLSSIVLSIGALLEAGVGSWLINKKIGSHNALTQKRSIILFALLGGPIACLISTTIGNSFLLAMEIIPANTFFYSWIFWWFGDTLGVLIFAPLFLILFATPRDVWRPRLTKIFIPLLICFILVSSIYYTVSKAEINRVREQFITVTQQDINALQKAFTQNITLDTQELLQSPMIASHTVSELDIVDQTNPNAPIALFNYTDPTNSPPYIQNNFKVQRTITNNTNTWLITAVASSNFLDQEYSLKGWLVLIIGLFICALVNISLFIMSTPKK